MIPNRNEIQAALGGYSLAQVEALLEKRYKGKNCRLQLPGIKDVYGMVEQISIDTRTNQDIIVIIGRRRYSFEIPVLNDVLTTLTKTDGNT